MRRSAVAVVILLSAVSMFAQEGRTRADGREPRAMEQPYEWNALARFEGDLRLVTKQLNRDAFITAKLAKASGELDDFQHHTAIEKAIDHVRDAQKRANEDGAPPQMITSLNELMEALEHARNQAAMADVSDLRRHIASTAHDVQYFMQREMQAARRLHQTLFQMVTRLETLNQEVDQAMVDALSSTFEVARK